MSASIRLMLSDISDQKIRRILSDMFDVVQDIQDIVAQLIAMAVITGVR